jgi:hypothetical protein
MSFYFAGLWAGNWIYSTSNVNSPALMFWLSCLELAYISLLKAL